MEEKYVIGPIKNDPGTPSNPPLTGGHLPLNEMGITPPPKDRVMDA